MFVGVPVGPPGVLIRFDPDSTRIKRICTYYVRHTNFSTRSYEENSSREAVETVLYS